MSEPVELVLSEREEGIRLDKVLAERLPDLTRTAIQRLLEEEQVLINGKPAAKNRKGRAGDSVALRIPDPEPLCLQAENVPLDIVYEDDDLLVVNKPQGMVVHPAGKLPGNPGKRLAGPLRQFLVGNQRGDTAGDCASNR